MKRIICLIMCCVCLSLISGCATILSHGNKTMPIISDPEGVTVEVNDMRMEKTVSKSNTPCQVTLERGDGYFLKKYYTINLSKEGYISEKVEISPGINFLYFCNLIFGGGIGAIFVDPVTGDMWKYYDDKVEVKLFPDTPEGQIAREEYIQAKLAAEEALKKQQMDQNINRR